MDPAHRLHDLCPGLDADQVPGAHGTLGEQRRAEARVLGHGKTMPRRQRYFLVITGEDAHDRFRSCHQRPSRYRQGMVNPRAYIVTYTGDGVAMLPSVGVFQAGTRAWVDAETAEAARRLPHFVVTGPDGVSARVVEEMAPPEPEPIEPVAAAPEPVAAAPEPVAAAPEPPPPAPAAPTRPGRRGRQSAVMAAVRPEETPAADASSSDTPKK